MRIRVTCAIRFMVIIAALMHSRVVDGNRRVLSQVQPGVFAGELSHRVLTRSVRSSARVMTSRFATGMSRHLAAFQAQRTTYEMLGQYQVDLIIGGIKVTAAIDTGTGITQLACVGAQTSPATLPKFNVTRASPALKPLSANSSSCKQYCTAYCLNSTSSCQYSVSYLSKASASGQVYSGLLSFPNMTLAAPLKTFNFGCANASSSDPYFFDSMSALVGINWQNSSLWGQLQSAGLVNDTMYLCMGQGNGADLDTNGLIVLGQHNSLRLPYNSSKVITVKLMDPAIFLSGTPGKFRLSSQTATVRLNSLSMGKLPSLNYSGSGEKSSAQYYMLDSGTSKLLLTTGDYASFLDIMGTFVQKYSSSALRYAMVYEGSALTFYMDKVYQPAELDAILPTLYFTLWGGSSPVPIKPSQYVIRSGGSEPSVGYIYNVFIGSSGLSNQGVFGNLWLAGWLVKQTKSSRSLTLTRVKSCKDIIY